VVTAARQPSSYAPRVPAGERRESILDAALVLFAGGGASAVTMEELARQAGVSKPVIYRHYPNTDAVLRALWTRERDAAIATVLASIPADADFADPTAAVPAALVGFMDAARTHPDRWRLLLAQGEWRDVEGRSEIVGMFAHLAELAFVDRAGGYLDPELTAHLIWAGVEEVLRLVLADPHAFPHERLEAFAIEVSRSLLGG
jgi:AcrR family transcriptional regulator